MNTYWGGQNLILQYNVWYQGIVAVQIYVFLMTKINTPNEQNHEKNQVKWGDMEKKHTTVKFKSLII